MFRRTLSTLPQRFADYVVPSYGRYTHLELSHGSGNRIFDTNGKSYVDFGGGIAVNCLGHAHPAILEAIQIQSSKLMHCSNLYLTASQAELAERLVTLFGRTGVTNGTDGDGKVFFCNSGAEANEGLYKLAKRFGLENNQTDIITTVNSFHGRTLGGIAATGQDKIKAGFGPTVPGFTHVPYNDVEAAANAITDKTAAILIEGIQGEGGVTPATSEYLQGLRSLCSDKNILLMMDSVQCGHFRSGSFQSYEQILNSGNGHSKETFRPDAVSMAKSIGGGFPMGGFWVDPKYCDLLSAGTHGTTYGGNPLGCAIALAILDVIDNEQLEQNVKVTGEYLRDQLNQLKLKYPTSITDIRGLGFMVGIVLDESLVAGDLVEHLHQHGMLTVPAGTSVVRLLPALNTTKADVDECIDILEKCVQLL
jgi:acetylornithine/N-succinyldiaminopimelate aminotransferase